jgi:VWFA-related protein
VVLDAPEQLVTQRVLVPLRVWQGKAGRYLSDPGELPLESLEIRERVIDAEGRPGRFVAQTPLSLDHERRPLSLALVIDVSGSMELILPAVRRAARDLVTRLGPEDRVAVLTFNQQVALVSDLTSDREAIRHALAGLSPRGGTALYDGIHAALDKLREAVDPRAVVVVTDGADTQSFLGADEVVAEAREARIPLFFVYHLVPAGQFRRLSAAARDTGGQVFQSGSDESLVETFGTIAEGLSGTFLLSYRSTHRDFDGSWRELRVETKRRGLRVQSAKRGYRALPPPAGEGPAEAPEAGGAGFTPPPAALTGAHPPLLCERSPLDLREWCAEGLRARRLPGPPPRLGISHWIDMGNYLGVSVDATRYDERNPLPDDPRHIRLKAWGSAHFGHYDELRLPLPPPEEIPRGREEFWRGVLGRGASFAVMGVEVDPGGGVRPVERRILIPPVPGLARALDLHEPISEERAPLVRWLDGELALAAREDFSRWLFLLDPAYRSWARDRFEQSTRRLAELELRTLDSRILETLPEALRAEVERSLERRLRAEREGLWRRYLAGEEAPLESLLVWSRDLRATEWLDRAERVLIDALLAGPRPEVATLLADWVLPARESWTRLRTFFAPAGHPSLSLGLPLLDERRGEISMPRVIMPWVQVEPGGGGLGDFPPARPEALEAVATLLADEEVGPFLAEGAYRCPEGGVTAWSHHPADWTQNPPEWWEQVESLRSERERLQEERRGEKRGRRSPDQRSALLRKEIRELKRATGVHLSVRLERRGSPELGIVLTRQAGSPLRAAANRDPGITVEIERGEGFRSLDDSLREAGYNLEEPRVANALLAARLGGYRDEVLADLLDPKGDLSCFEPGGRDAVRFLFRPGELTLSAPPRVSMEDRREILEINLASASAAELRASARRICSGQR